MLTDERLRQLIERHPPILVYGDLLRAVEAEATADLRADNERLRALLRDMKPYWDSYTNKRIWTSDVTGLRASIRKRIDAALGEPPC